LPAVRPLSGCLQAHADENKHKQKGPQMRTGDQQEWWIERGPQHAQFVEKVAERFVDLQAGPGRARWNELSSAEQYNFKHLVASVHAVSGAILDEQFEGQRDR
jgi:hypothetical protein